VTCIPARSSTLGAAVLRAAGDDLRDDATVLVSDWYAGGYAPT
jgi:hypothetical protein